MATGSLLPGSAKSEQQHRADLCIAGRWMYERGYIVACEGNLSVRLDEERVLTTPTCMNKGMLAPDDLVIIDLEGRHIAGERKASSELAMHLLFYRMRPDVQAIVHAHPPTATGFAAAGIPLTEPLVCEVVMGLGCIPLARYGTPGTSELAQTLEPYVPNYDAILMSNHGVVTYGDTLEHAKYMRDTVIPAMDATRAAADTLEKVVADDLWPLPKYSEILFVK